MSVEPANGLKGVLYGLAAVMVALLAVIMFRKMFQRELDLRLREMVNRNSEFQVGKVIVIDDLPQQPLDVPIIHARN